MCPPAPCFSVSAHFRVGLLKPLLMTKNIEALQNEIDLIEAQIKDIEQSGFFTDNQIKSKTRPLYSKLYKLTIKVINEKIASDFLKQSGFKNFNPIIRGLV